MFLFLSGRRDGAFRVIPVTSDSGLLVSRPLRLALKRRCREIDPDSMFLVNANKKKLSTVTLYEKKNEMLGGRCEDLYITHFLTPLRGALLAQRHYLQMVAEVVKR